MITDEMSLAISKSEGLQEVLASLPEHTKVRLENLLQKLNAITKSSRKQHFELGKVLSGMRDEVVEYGEQKVTAWITGLGMSSTSYYRFVKLYERLAPYEDCVSQFALTAQLRIGDGAVDDGSLAQAAEAARRGDEVSVTMLFAQQQPVVEVEIGGEKDDATEWEDVEEEDEEEEDEDVEELSQPSIAAKLPQDIEGVRSAMVRHLINLIGSELRAVDKFLVDHSLPRGTWYKRVDDGCNEMLEGIREWGASKL